MEYMNRFFVYKIVLFLFLVSCLINASDTIDYRYYRNQLLANLIFIISLYLSFLISFFNALTLFKLNKSLFFIAYVIPISFLVIIAFII